jgi:hypothetical protein
MKAPVTKNVEVCVCQTTESHILETAILTALRFKHTKLQLYLLFYMGVRAGTAL